MNDHGKTKEQLIAELAEMRNRIADLETSESKLEQTEASLRESDEKWRSLVENAPSFIVIVDRDGVIQFINRTQSGRPMGEPIGKSIYDFAHPDYHDTIRECLDRVFETGETGFYETAATDSNGNTWWYETRAARLKHNGESVNALLVSTNVTHRREAEKLLQEARDNLEERVRERTEELARANEQLRESEQRCRSLVEATNDYVWQVDQNGVLTYISPQVRDALGYDPEEVVGKTPLEFMCREEGEDEIVEVFGKIVASQKPFFGHEGVCLHKDGRRVIVETNGVPIFDAGQNHIGICGLSRDITERRRMEEELRSSEERYRTLVESSPDAVIMTDLEGRITFASKRLLELHGSDSLEEMYGRNPLDFFAPEDHQRMLANLMKAVAEGGLGDREYTLVKKDGTRFPGEMSSTVVCDHSGEPVGLTVLVRDITERKQAQEALEREHRVLRQMLQSQDQERRLVAYDIHDGVAQHLTAAMMQFQACDEMEDRNSDDAEACHAAGLRMLGKALSETRRLISGLRPPILDESGIVAAIAHLIHDIRAQGGPEVEFHSSVKFDRLEPTLENSIFRIVQESLTNAHRHAKADRVRIELTQNDDTVSILVEDQGIGFDPENVDKRCYGLAGIRERARVLGGSGIIRSAPGEGTRIDVELPVAAVKAGD